MYRHRVLFCQLQVKSLAQLIGLCHESYLCISNFSGILDGTPSTSTNVRQTFSSMNLTQISSWLTGNYHRSVGYLSIFKLRLPVNFVHSFVSRVFLKFHCRAVVRQPMKFYEANKTSILAHLRNSERARWANGK